MYPTAEVRWFHQGATPPAVAAWFRGVEGIPEEEPTRVDYYLRLVGTDSLSIKVREGRVEVKQRHLIRGVVRFHERVIGGVELWRKWSLPLGEAAGQGPYPDIVAPHWLAIEKRRAVRRYRQGGERVVAASPAEEPDQGCNLELTRVRVGREAWWTVGLEAYGSETDLENTLQLVAGYLMSGAEPPPLAVDDSYGYPAWLQRLEQETDGRPGGARGPAG